MGKDSPSKTARPRRNRILDLLYLPASFLVFVALFQIWQYGATRVLGSSGSAALTAGAMFPIAALPIYTRLALGMGPMVIHLIALAVVVQSVPALLPLSGVQTLVGGLVGGLIVANPKGRGSVIAAGAWAGAASAALFGLVFAQGMPPPVLVTGVIGALMSGTLAGALVLTLSPLLERVFGHVTPLTLIEALSYDHPLVRRLITEAPGTFQHSTNLGILSDAAARAIGADSLVARVGALYHDVGKTLAPGDFMENQRGELQEDTRSAEQIASTLVRHVTDGATLIKAFGLGDIIANFALEHHGTSPMRSLAHRAGKEGLPAGQIFQYPGPRPRSKETAIVMIGDQIEAIARARPPQTRNECIALVRETIARIQADSQLVYSGLTPEELTRMDRAFARALHAMHHRRIGYPASDLTPEPLPQPSIVALSPHHRKAD